MKAPFSALPLSPAGTAGAAGNNPGVLPLPASGLWPVRSMARCYSLDGAPVKGNADTGRASGGKGRLSSGSGGFQTGLGRISAAWWLAHSRQVKQPASWSRTTARSAGVKVVVPEIDVDAVVRASSLLTCMPPDTTMYASQTLGVVEVVMARRATLKRKSFFVDERMLGRAKRVLGVSTDSEAIRLAVERTAEMEAFWQFMKNTRRTVKTGSLKAP